MPMLCHIYINTISDNTMTCHHIHFLYVYCYENSEKVSYRSQSKNSLAIKYIQICSYIKIYCIGKYLFLKATSCSICIYCWYILSVLYQFCQFKQWKYWQLIQYFFFFFYFIPLYIKFLNTDSTYMFSKLVTSLIRLTIHTNLIFSSQKLRKHNLYP